MNSTTINGALLKDMFLAGAALLEKNKAYIDSLNVFPVPDGDTGTNMSMTMQSAAREIKACPEGANVGKVAAAASLGALKGARGNSGVILSQIFRGMAKALDGKEEMDAELLVTALRMGTDAAYKAVMKPKEGTILTVSRMISTAVEGEFNQGANVFGLIDVMMESGEEALKLTPELLRAAITPRTKVLILPYPCNPTGGIMEKADLEAIAEVLKDTNIAVISDEIYAELTYGGKHVSPANIPALYDRTIVVNGFSKAYSMTGWRLGFLCAPPAAVTQLVKLHQFGIMSAPTTSQYAAIEALKEGDRDIEAMRADYDRRRRFLVHGLREAGLECYEPKGAFYVFPCIKSTGMTSDEVCEKFLLSERVAAIPGTAFGPGGEGFVRMCYATSMDELNEALVRLKRFLGKL